MAEYAIPVSFELAGEWFLADAPDNKMPGTLSWGSDRARLRLNDLFKRLQGAVHAGDTTNTRSRTALRSAANTPRS